jgi:hypothetical protein
LPLADGEQLTFRVFTPRGNSAVAAFFVFAQESFMTHAEMERELSRSTGESLATIRRRGFQLVEPPVARPRLVDWDELDAERVSIVPQRSRQNRRLIAA